MHEIHGGSDFRLHDDYGITLSSVDQRLMFAFSWVHRGSTAMTVGELKAIYFVSWQYVYIFDCFHVLIHCDTLDK